MEAVSSSLSKIHLGRQSAVDVAATKFNTALALTGGGAPQFNVRETPVEFPSPVNRSTRKKSPNQNRGYRVPITGSMLFHPRFLGHLLLGAGFKVTSVASTGYNTHTFVIANRNELILLSAILDMTSDDNVTFRRIIENYRLTNLTIDGTPDDLQANWDGFGTKESAFTAGSETFAAESNVELSPQLGTLTLNINGEAITSLFRGSQFVVEQTISDNERFLWTAEEKNRQVDIGVSGSLTDFDMDYDIYRNIYYGAPAGTEVSLIPATGDIAYTHESPTVIGVTAVPYSFGVSIENVDFMLEVPPSSGADFVQCSLNWEMLDASATPITITLVNDILNYNA
jgi:hypothetical protein